MAEKRIRFEAITIHKNSKGIPDHEDRPFIQTSRLEEGHGNAIYSCSFNPFLPSDHNPICATVGHRYAHIYECPLASNTINLLGAFFCNSKSESLYSSAWAFDTYEHSRGRNPYMLLTAGKNSYIYVIDASTQKLVNKLTSHGGPVNEIRICPTNSNIVASASFDKTIRIFHIRNNGCLIVIGGPDSHADQILSLDWSLCASYIISSGLDHTIFKWSLKRSPHKETIENACKLLSYGRKNSLSVSKDDAILRSLNRIDLEREPTITLTKRKLILAKDFEKKPESQNAVMQLIERMHSSLCTESFVPLYYPAFKNFDLHSDYVDCVRYFSNSEFIFSKGCGRESVIYMSRFGSLDPTKQDEDCSSRTDPCSSKLMQKNLPNGETWFIKFDLDPLNKWLVCGSNIGMVHFYDLHEIHRRNPTFSMTIGSRPVRQITFSPNGRVLLAVSDDGSINRIDRIHNQVKPVPTFKICVGPNVGVPRSTRRKRAEEDDEGEHLKPSDRARVKARSDASVKESKLADS